MAALGLLLVIVIGLGAYYLISGARHAPPANPTAVIGAGSAAHHRATHRTGHPSAAPTAAAQPYAREVVIRLAAIEDCWVEFTTPAGGYLTEAYVSAGTSKSWTFAYPVDMQLGNPGGVSLAVDGKNPLPPGTVNPITLSLRPGGSVSTGG